MKKSIKVVGTAKAVEAKKISRIKELLDAGYSKHQIAFYVSSSYTEIDRIVKDYSLSALDRYDEPQSVLDVKSLSDINLPVWEEERKMVSKILDKYNSFTVLNDWHSPYQNNNLIDDMLKHDTNKVLITVGDIFHLDSASRFRKNRLVSFSEELRVVLNILSIMSKKYEYIVLLMANHERRYIHMLYDRLPTEYAETLKHNSLLTKRIASIFPGNVLETDGWWLKVGKAILAHPDWYTKSTGKTVKNSYEYFMSFGETDFDAILNAHTHKCSKFMSMNKVMVELPCACKPQEYMNDGHRYNAEYYQGWTTFKTGKDGSVGFNDIDIHLYNKEVK